MWKLMEGSSRLLFCTPPSEDFSAKSPSKKRRILYYASVVYDVLDFVDAILDTVAAIRMILGDKQGQGIILLGGIALARAIAAKGKHVLLHCKGLMWVPFCQNPVIFMGNMSIEEQLNMRALYAILFTEIAVFLFEDSVLVSIWIFEDGFDRSDTYDVMNGWVTLLSTFMGCAILIVSVILSLRHWVWGSTFCDVMNQLMSSLLFCALFGCIFLYLVFVMLTGFQIAAGIDEDEPILDFADFLLFVCFSWAIATYFSCKLRWQAVQPQRLIHQGDESALGGTAVHDVEIDGGMNSNGDGNGAYVLPVSPEPTSSHEDEAVEVPIAVAVPVNDPF